MIQSVPAELVVEAHAEEQKMSDERERERKRER